MRALLLMACTLGAPTAAFDGGAVALPEEAVAHVTRGRGFPGEQLGEVASRTPAVTTRVERQESPEALRTETADASGHVFLEQTVQFESGVPVLWTAQVPRPPVLAMGPSVTRFMAQHVAELRRGSSVAFEMAVPQRMDVFSLELAPGRDFAGSVPEVATGRWLEVAIRPRSRVARVFAPKMVAFIDAASGETQVFLGPTPSGKAGDSPLMTLRYEAAQ